MIVFVFIIDFMYLYFVVCYVYSFFYYLFIFDVWVGCIVDMCCNCWLLVCCFF